MKYKVRILMLTLATVAMLWASWSFYRAITTPVSECYVQRSGYCDNP